ncbi:MAG: hypothetical protein Q8O05_04570 [Chloroflexota bacterium]|nr:hypothetical protein [Chloroflexota bacterium]
MSRFIDKLSQVSQVASSPMGFKAVLSAAARPKMVLAVVFAEASTEGLADYVAGADVAILSIKSGSGISGLKKMAEAALAIPWGGWLSDVADEDIESLAKAGADFVVFPETASLALAGKSELGKVLQIDASLDAGLLRAIEDLPVDAVLVETDKKEGLSWHSLLLFQRLAGLLTKPLLVSLPSTVTQLELQALLEVGVDGIIVEAKVGEAARRLGELHQMIDMLTPVPARKRKKAEPVVPYIRPEAEVVEEEEEEEEEE